jgi:hypothetical protein
MKAIIVTLFSILLCSCSNKPTLQKYFVDNMEDKNFIAIDISPSILNLEKVPLSASEEKALETFDKMNVIAFKNDSLSNTKFKEEDLKIKAILKEETYQELMKFGSGAQAASVYYVGEDDNIDEFVVYAKNTKSGFALVRVLGDNMNPADIFTLIEVLKKSKIDIEQLKPLEAILK